MEEERPPVPAWITIQADEFSATVSSKTLMRGANASSVLANLVEMEALKQLQDPGQLSVRLDCSAEVAREVVAMLRQGPSYVPPADSPRLLRAVQHQADFLGISAPTLPSSGGAAETREVVLVPSYWYLGINYDLNTSMLDPMQAGLLIYSAGARGWANIAGRADPRPADVRGDDHPHSGGGCWLASVMRAETTGAGEDLVFMVPNKTYSSRAYGDTAVVLRSSLTSGRVAMPPVHKRMGLCDSAMAAAQGKLYLLGGSCHLHLQVAPSTCLEVFDAHIGAWFTSASPVTGPASLAEHALVANESEGLLLALGGCLTSGDRRHRQSRGWDGVAALDVRGGRWALNPSGCTWPGAATSYGVSAVAADPYTIMVLSMDHSGQAVRTDLLDLRTWAWRPGALLQRRPGGGAADEDECLFNMGLVKYDGKVLAVGGRHYWRDPGQGPVQEWATTRVLSYDIRQDSWGEAPPLPFPLCHAAPVAVRLQSALL